jgi:GxxExxY protein
MRIEATTKIIYAELSYAINGICFKTQNDLGRLYNEKQYCDKIEQHLKEAGLEYEREKVLPPSFEGENPGRNKLDFLIENKIILEVKAKRILSRTDYYQVQRYLQALNLKLGILVNFKDEAVKPKRILNSSGQE